jgi:isoleucyl-tRNA synthetase
MVRWIAPILSYTSDEIWETMQQELGSMERSVFTTQWYDGLQAMPYAAVMNKDFWQDIMGLRDLVNKQCELARSAGTIKASLGAEVTLYVSEKWQQHISLLGDELRFVLITSATHVLPLSAKPEDMVTVDINAQIAVAVYASEHAKCERCWHHRADVGSHEGHEGICGRCIENVVGVGEVRHYA